MPVEEDDHQPLTPEAADRVRIERALYAGIQAQDEQARKSAQWELVKLQQVPDFWVEEVLMIYLRARRVDEGVRRKANPDQQAAEIHMLKGHMPVMALIRAAYRGGVHDALYPGDMSS